MSAPEPVIRLRGIHNQFGRQVVHHDLDLDVYRGEILGVVGGSGTGKSVLLKTIVGLQTPQEGEIEVLGYDLRRGGDEARDKVDDRWGVMFQDGALFSSLTVRENVEVPLRHVPDLDPKTHTLRYVNSNTSKINCITWSFIPGTTQHMPRNYCESCRC